MTDPISSQSVEQLYKVARAHALLALKRTDPTDRSDYLRSLHDVLQADAESAGMPLDDARELAHSMLDLTREIMSEMEHSRA